MNIVRCKKCGWFGCEEYTDLWMCPNCTTDEFLDWHLDYTKQYSKFELETLWDLFGDIPINDNDEIEEVFLEFEEGTNRFDIWKWFDVRYPGGVHELIESRKC